MRFHYAGIPNIALALTASSATVNAPARSPYARAVDAPRAALAVQRDREGHAWWRHAVFYEIYLRSFGDANDAGLGDLAAISQCRAYLDDLRVDALIESGSSGDPSEVKRGPCGRYRATMP